MQYPKMLRKKSDSKFLHNVWMGNTNTQIKSEPIWTFLGICGTLQFV